MKRASAFSPATAKAADRPARRYAHTEFRTGAHRLIAEPIWEDTVPSELGANAVVSEPSREVSEGLVLRELSGVDLVRHLFGAGRG